MYMKTRSCLGLCMAFKENSSDVVFLYFFFLIFRCILSTDMARHNEILDKFKVILADGFSFENEAHKSMVRVMFPLKTATVCENIRTWCLYCALGRVERLCLCGAVLFFCSSTAKFTCYFF